MTGTKENSNYLYWSWSSLCQWRGPTGHTGWV